MYDHKLDQLLSIKSSESHLEKFVIINAAMALSVAVTLLLSVFDFAQGEELAKALLAEIKRRKRQEAKKKMIVFLCSALIAFSVTCALVSYLASKGKL